MKSSRQWSNGLMSMLGLCVVMGALLTSGCGQGSGDTVAIAAPPSNPGPPVTDLSGVTQNWDKALPAAERFVILAGFNNAAVRDNNTGLVWELSPTTTTVTWATAIGACINKAVGGQKGWRLPAIAELASLIDPSVPSPGPNLPPGHPFLNIQSATYWSASTDADSHPTKWLVRFIDGAVFAQAIEANTFHLWCVRGPMQESVY